jgi:nucleoside-diphosphate-sugar epimerase
VAEIRRGGGSGSSSIIADLDKPEALRRLFAAMKFDVVFVMVGMHAEHARTMLEACETIGAHLVWTSTVCVFGGPLYQGKASDESPLHPVSDYGRHKADAEAVLLSQQDVPVTIVRPASTASPGFPILRQFSVSNGWIQRVLENKPVAVGPDPDLLWSCCTSADIASAYRLIAEFPDRCTGEAFIVTHPLPDTWREWHERVARCLDKKAQFIQIPHELIIQSELPHGLYEEQSQWNQHYDPQKFMSHFPEWRNLESREQAIRKALDKQQYESPDELERLNKIEDKLIAQRGY